MYLAQSQGKTGPGAGLPLSGYSYYLRDSSQSGSINSDYEVNQPPYALTYSNVAPVQSGSQKLIVSSAGTGGGTGTQSMPSQCPACDALSQYWWVLLLAVVAVVFLVVVVL